MPKLIPAVDPDDIGVDSERMIAKALMRTLPDHCVVYHSYPWLRPDRNDRTGNVTLSEGEVDFLIIHPDFGLLVLEVKGGQVWYDSGTREWKRRSGLEGEKVIKDPFEQARRNTHFLVERIRESAYPAEQYLPYAYGYAAVFPHCVYSGPTPPGAEPVIVWDGRDLDALDKHVEKALKAWCRGEKPRPLDKGAMQTVQRAISPAFRLSPALFRMIESEEERLVRLTDEQLRLLDILSAHERVVVQGVAGSGKTMLARTQAARFAEAGRKTLFLCYNKGLAGWVEQSLPDHLRDRITVRHFHRLCNEKAHEAGLPFDPAMAGDRNFWMEIAPEILLEGVSATEERFDAIVVDEGQDFHPDWWLPIESINAKGEGGPLYIFCDPAQNLFIEGESRYPVEAPPLNLTLNCRNTKNIASTCSRILGVSIATSSHAPDGTEVKQLTYPNRKEGRQIVKDELDAWIKRGRLSSAQVAIMTPVKKEKTILEGLDSLGPHKLTDDYAAWQAGMGILVTTIRAFKGLEADAVILLDAQEIERSSHMSNADYYVGCSRAKHLLTVARLTS